MIKMLYPPHCCLLEYDLMTDSSDSTIKIQSRGVTPFPSAAWAVVPHSLWPLRLRGVLT